MVNPFPVAGSFLDPVLGYEPNSRKRFGDFGGQLVPEALIPAINEVSEAFFAIRTDEDFRVELHDLHKHYSGRPSPLYECRRFGRGGVTSQELLLPTHTTARFFLKREDLNHTGSHKINNVLGQVLLAKHMGKKRVIAETGAGQHGVATATACALLGLECVIFMGKVDTERQALNVTRMRLLGAQVISVVSGSQTLKDAITEAMRDWVTHADTTYYCFGTAAGPFPFPLMVRDFQRIIGVETRMQVLDQTGQLPDAVLACIGGGSNAIGIFHPFLDDPSVRLVGCEAAGSGVETGLHAASITGGTPGYFQGSYSYLLQDNHGQIVESHSISAGLDYPGVGPEHSHLFSIGRAEYIPITDDEAMEAFGLLSREEGIIPAIESAHALAGALKLAPKLAEEHATPIIVVNLSGRGDKDVEVAGTWFNIIGDDGKVLDQETIGE